MHDLQHINLKYNLFSEEGKNQLRTLAKDKIFFELDLKNWGSIYRKKIILVNFFGTIHPKL